MWRRRPAPSWDTTSELWSAFHLVHSSGTAWRLRWTAWVPGRGAHADSVSGGMVSGVSVIRHERPHAHHELALRSAGGDAGYSRARAAPLAAASSASMRLQPCTCWTAFRLSGHPGMYTAGHRRSCWVSSSAWIGSATPPLDSATGARTYWRSVELGSTRPVTAQAVLTRRATPPRNAGRCHLRVGWFLWFGGDSRAQRGGDGVWGGGWASWGLALALGSPLSLGSPRACLRAALSRPPWTAPHFFCVVWFGPRESSAPNMGSGRVHNACVPRVPSRLRLTALVWDGGSSAGWTPRLPAGIFVSTCLP